MHFSNRDTSKKLEYIIHMCYEAGDFWYSGNPERSGRELFKRNRNRLTFPLCTFNDCLNLEIYPGPSFLPRVRMFCSGVEIDTAVLSLINPTGVVWALSLAQFNSIYGLFIQVF